jgi:hypothetical protein
MRTFKEELLLRLLPLCVPTGTGSLIGDKPSTTHMRETFIKDARENAQRMVLFADVCDQVINSRSDTPTST